MQTDQIAINTGFVPLTQFFDGKNGLLMLFG
jgi:hypothetical protein